MLLTLMLLCSIAPLAVAAQPTLNWIAPLGATRGEHVEMTFVGDRLADAAQILAYEPGLTFTELRAENEQQLHVVVDVAPDAPLGEHQVRIRTRSGISELRTFWVVPFPTLREEEPNNDFAKPQPIALNTTIRGQITNEDVDYFVVDAKADQRISVEIVAMRLGRAFFDPAIAILDERRFELAASDDSALGRQDGVLSVRAPADGKYIVRVQEAAYGGSDQCVYLLHIGDFPRPLVAFPPGGEPGTETHLTLCGDALGPIEQTVAIASDAGDIYPVFPKDAAGIAPTPVWLRVSDLPIVTEAGPTTQPTTQPTAYDVPVALHGTIATPSETDEWRFNVRAQQSYIADIFARRVRSPLDAVLSVQREGGEGGVSDDDSAGVDARVRFTAQSDSVCVARVRDQRGRGGEQFVYRLEITQPAPALSLALPLMNSRAFQYRQTLPVPQGGRNAILVRAAREDIGGDVQLAPTTQPAGTQFEAPPIAADTDAAPLVFSAAADAPLAGVLTPLVGKIAREAGDVTGELRQDIVLVTGPPNIQVYDATRVDSLAVAVTEPAPFNIELAAPTFPIVRAGTMQLRVTATRAEGFAAAIECRMLWNPPGISSAGSVTINPDQTAVDYPISTSGDAPLAHRPLCIIARADTGRGEIWTSTNLVDLEITEPYVGGSIQMTAVERSQTARILVTLAQHKPFEGPATLQLLNLPAHAKAEPLQITAESPDAVFEVATTPQTPVGTSNNLFCQLVITQAGAPITHQFGHGGVLRVDAPRVAAAESKPEPQPPPEAAKEQPKPLSRLEQLRQQAANGKGQQ